VLASKDAELGRAGDVDLQTSSSSSEFAHSDAHKYSPSDFNFVKILGKGSFGKVRRKGEVCVTLGRRWETVLFYTMHRPMADQLVKVTGQKGRRLSYQTRCAWRASCSGRLADDRPMSRPRSIADGVFFL